MLAITKIPEQNEVRIGKIREKVIVAAGCGSESAGCGFGIGACDVLRLNLVCVELGSFQERRVIRLTV